MIGLSNGVIFLSLLKDHCSFGEQIQTQNFITYDINQVVLQSRKYFFFSTTHKQAVLRGPPNINKVIFPELHSAPLI